MKNITNIKGLFLVMMVMVFAVANANAQTSSKKGNVTETVIINTSAQCDMCRMKIEGKLNESKGIRLAALDIKTKKLTVKFNPEKTTADEIRKIVSDLGYDADNLKANQDAHKNLPDCCQKH